MGWKNVKEHYQIGHSVQVTDKGICIGSPYVHDLIVLGLDGKVLKRFDRRSNEDLTRYQDEFDADPEMLRRLIEAPDEFSASITIYTYCGGEVLEMRCEEPTWPNVTHDGQMIYDNTFSTDKEAVVAWAKKEAVCGLRYAEESVAEAEKRLAECQERRRKVIADLERLETDYPPKFAKFTPVH